MGGPRPSFIALSVTAMNLGSKTFSHGEDTQKHRGIAAKLWNLRESYLSLIVDIQAGALALNEGREVRDRLQQQALEVYGDAPRTTPKAYAAAQLALKDKEDLTFSPREIDQLLPVDLRKTGERPAREIE
ncbi:SLATT domain-containing protein [Lentzea guizhouensis]|uniref:SLATT domain-containing protein n=1 Tax=Lentzea guizhouensis TaxID=1586287 RepID=UPI001C54D5C0|nr:SLATT domain-containing protein [Lentzea guizhouensis]